MKCLGGLGCGEGGTLGRDQLSGTTESSVQIEEFSYERVEEWHFFVFAILEHLGIIETTQSLWIVRLKRN